MSRPRKFRPKPEPQQLTHEETIALLQRIEPSCNIEQKYRGALRIQQEASEKSDPNPQS